MSFCCFLGAQRWYHCCKPEKDFGNFLWEMSWAVHSVSNAHQVTDINVCCIIAHRSPPVDQQNSASIVETDQPEVPAVGTKRAKMMPGSKIVLPSSDAEEYSGNILQTAMIRIANSKGMILFSCSPKFLRVSCRLGQKLLHKWQLPKLVAKRYGVCSYDRYILRSTHVCAEFVAWVMKAPRVLMPRWRCQSYIT